MRLDRGSDWTSRHSVRTTDGLASSSPIRGFLMSQSLLVEVQLPDDLPRFRLPDRGSIPAPGTTRSPGYRPVPHRGGTQRGRGAGQPRRVAHAASSPHRRHRRMSTYIPATALTRQVIARAGNRVYILRLVPAWAGSHVPRRSRDSHRRWRPDRSMRPVLRLVFAQEGRLRAGRHRPRHGRRIAAIQPTGTRLADISGGMGFGFKALTATGRVTVAALEMNRPLILAIRDEEAERGRHPPRG